MPSLTTCMMSSDKTEGAMSVNKQWLANSVFCPVLSPENPNLDGMKRMVWTVKENCGKIVFILPFLTV